MSPRQARELTPALGAQITGVELHGTLDAETVDFLRTTFDDRGLLLFRGVDVDRAGQYALATVLMGRGQPTPDEARAGAARQGSFAISNRAPDAAAPFGRLLYHSDGMWSDEPFEVLSLFATEVQPPVVPTAFASAAHGWDTLPDELRARVEGLHAEHVTGPEHIHERRRRTFGGELSQAVRQNPPSETTRVAFSHPRTGRTLLYVTQGMTRGIVELAPDESEDLLEELFDHLYRAEAVYEHQWREGDLVLWDNLALQHGRPNVTLEGPARTLRKVGLPLPRNVEAHQVQSYQRVS